MAGIPIFDATGAGTPRPPVDVDTGLNRIAASVADDNPDGTAAADLNFGQEAKDAVERKDFAAANEAAANIRDPELREVTFISIRQAQGELAFFTVASSQFDNETVGVKDPNGLFFMLIFYLTERAPGFAWSDILKSASSIAGSDFASLSPKGSNPDALFPLPSSTVVDVVQIEPAQNKQEAKQNTALGGKKTFAKRVREAQEANEKNLQEREDKSEQLLSEREQEGTRRVEDVQQDKMASVVWPFQNMPIIESGWSKSVEWGSSETQAISFAEPIRTNDGGASAIELDVSFTYAVGVPGMGPHGQFPWTVEEIMGMIYLATSLVYPYRSVLFNVSGQDEVEKQKKAQAQFPVLFLRHYSLFPFLTPFVVSQVQIQPDENQPLIITEPQRLGSVPTHLTIPAVRQVVTITLSLKSAHFYLPVFASSGDGFQDLQTQTSGRTFLSLAGSLLADKFKGGAN